MQTVEPRLSRPPAQAPDRPGPGRQVDIASLRRLALDGLARMYRPPERRFAFRLRRTPEGLRAEGSSARYTAMALIGLAAEPADTVAQVLAGDSLRELAGQLLDELRQTENLGDLALSYWAARLAQHPGADGALGSLRRLFWSRAAHPTVELAWTLAGLCAAPGGGEAEELARSAARLLLLAFQQRAAVFAHTASWRGWWLRRHVACFADLVYPVHALACYQRVGGDSGASRAARRCAARLCASLGPEGQWWWHYDVRTGRVVERYPVYAVHQDAMAPMALFALAEAGGPGHQQAIGRGLAWLTAAPELGGGSLIDRQAGLIWRKVARREPGKLVRRAQALAARIHRSLRVPAVEALFPAERIDEECRPYHLGWLLYAWPAQRAAAWDRAGPSGR